MTSDARAGPIVRVGVVSDTHGLLRPEVLLTLGPCDLILHAGDVGSADVLAGLRSSGAAVAAVRGNVDHDPHLATLPQTLAGAIEGLRYRVVHRREDVESAWPREHDLVVFGHSHRPELEWRSGCLLLNPGACGGRRFKLPLTVARITISRGRWTPEILAVAEGTGC
ncbi:MAG TPA: metallophosphoesterase family protein [Thermoanaerobaculia bacterium]|nr:metallophosphoesterase family protein [Thermoanaerobaculia bacterium]